VLLCVAGTGGRLNVAGDKLRMLLPANCAPELKDAIRLQKSALLDLLQLTFLIVRSDALNSIVFFVTDEKTKELLVSAGADPGVIYTTAELSVVVRRKISVEELLLIHTAKQRFNGKVTNPGARRV
jgi:hypothetical protein